MCVSARYVHFLCFWAFVGEGKKLHSQLFFIQRAAPSLPGIATRAEHIGQAHLENVVFIVLLRIVKFVVGRGPPAFMI